MKPSQVIEKCRNVRSLHSSLTFCAKHDFSILDRPDQELMELYASSRSSSVPIRPCEARKLSILDLRTARYPADIEFFTL